MIAYDVGASGQVVVVADAVVEHLRGHRQLRWYRREAGGQLFARFSGQAICIVEATGPRRSDRRTRTSYVPDREAELREISIRHARGLHFVGDWHTHPEIYPAPSLDDEASVVDCYRESSHTLNAFLLVIVGKAEPPAGLYVCAHNDSSSLVLEPRAWRTQAGLARGSTPPRPRSSSR